MSEPGTTKAMTISEEPMSPKEFGLLLRVRREGLKLTQLGVADWLGVTKGAVSHWENGRVEGINPLHMVGLVKILKLEDADIKRFPGDPAVFDARRDLPPLPHSDLHVIRLYAALPESLRGHVRGIIQALSTSQGDLDEQEEAEGGHRSNPESGGAAGQADGRPDGGKDHAERSQSAICQGGCGVGQGEETARTDASEAKAKRQIASEILSANVRALIEQVGSGADLARLTGVPQKTISRIANGENAVTLDTLNDLAKGAHLQPWQLLSPGLDLSNPPLLFQRDAPNPDLCPTCLGNDQEMPCAYPSEGKPGCLRSNRKAP